MSGLSFNLAAQQFSLQWAQKFGRSGWDYVNSVIPTSSGSLMLGGSLKGTLNQGKRFPELSNNNAFLAACDTRGNILWQKIFGGKGFSNITSLASIPQGIMISGIFQDTIRFDSLFAAAKSYTGGYLALADEQGKPVWLKNTGGLATISNILLCSNAKGKVFMAGTFADSLQLAGMEQAIHGEEGFFLATLLPDGREVNPVVIKSKGKFSLGGISVNDSLICMGGSFSDTLFVNDTMLVSAGREDVFLMMFSPEGAFKHMISAGGPGIDQVRSITFSSTGEICVTGCFEYAFLADNQMLKSKGGKDIFVAVIQQSGRLKWLRRIGGAGDDYGHFITVNDKNDIFVSGNFVHHIQMPDEHGLIVEMDAKSPFGNAFIAKYNINGEFKASFNLPATSEDYCKSLIAAPNGSITAAGNFYNRMQLKDSEGQVNELISAGERDIFLLRFNDRCQDVTIDAGADTAFCPGQSVYLRPPESYPFFQWMPEGMPNQDLEVKKAGTYKLLITDEHGCMASDSLQVKMRQLPLVFAGHDSLIASGGILRLEHASAANATEVNWTSDGSGSFASPGVLCTSYSPSDADISKGRVQLTLSAANHCGTACSNFFLSFKQDEDGIAAFPNPTHHMVTFVCNKGKSIRSASVTSQAGEVIVANLAVYSTVLKYDLSAYPSGTFIFHLNDGTTTVTKVITKL